MSLLRPMGARLVGLDVVRVAVRTHTMISKTKAQDLIPDKRAELAVTRSLEKNRRLRLEESQAPEKDTEQSRDDDGREV